MTPDSNSPERIMQFAWGFAPPLTIEVAIRNRIFDFLDTRPHTVQEVAEYAKGSTRGWRAVLNCLVGLDLFSRFEFLAGDLLEVEFPERCDVATLGHILHSEGETRSRALLKKVNDALKPGGTIAIAEFTPNSDRTGPPQSLIFAVNMLVNTDVGDTYPFEQVAGWLEEAGFVNARELPSAGPAPLILANRSLT
jgi:SAM-dependent methyltransferase